MARPPLRLDRVLGRLRMALGSTAYDGGAGDPAPRLGTGRT